jgi:hypothetical protein
MLGEHAADRSDPETALVLGDERADRTGQRRLRGSLSRTKKDLAALSISIVCSGVSTPRISAAASLVTPSRCPSSTCCLRIQFRNVSAFIPNRLNTAVIVAHSLG